VIYVGKAKNLKNRISSYFSSKKDIKTRILVSRATSIDYITTENEYEALLLENTLIKQHHISPGQITRLKRNESVSTHTIENFCKILKCRVEDIMEYIPDPEDE
jgi:excinuclease ABC subunit C